MSAEDDTAPASGRRDRIARALRSADEHPWLRTAAQKVRARLPGDDRYGDPLSLGRDAPPGLVGERLSLIAAERRAR